MANHLREWIECAEAGRINHALAFSAERATTAVRWTQHESDKAMCFDAGAVDAFDGLSIIDELVRLPYQTCWVEFNKPLGDVVMQFAAMLREADGGIEGTAWFKDGNDWNLVFVFESIRGDGQSKVVGNDDDKTLDVTECVISIVRAFLSALNCTNVRRVEHKPDAKLQKARAKRGKQPLFSYWTLELDLSRAESGESLGGTHASPRLHLRRGHPRQYAPGKYTWVQPCVVGNKAAGMVHKDYRMEARA